MIDGIVTRAQGGVYDVRTANGDTLAAVLRGRLKREARLGDRVVVGDRVAVEETGSGDAPWSIEQVHPRVSTLARRAPGKAPRAKVIVANVDQIVIVFAAANPEPHLRMVDRFLVLCEANDLPALIVVNKVDVSGQARAMETFGVYSRIGYPVVFTSTKGEPGVEPLESHICGKTSALAGPSGVGKSSLLNAIQPGLALRVSSVSESVRKGRHTTVTAQLVALECGGFVADTPGLRELGLWGVDLDTLDWCFPEFRPLLGSCRFGNSCTHVHEPGCAVMAELDSTISGARYESYRRMRTGEDED